MQHNDVYLQSAVNAAAVNAWRVAQKIGLSVEDREDVEQEILLELLERESRYDPARGMPGTFTGVVAKNRAAELIQAIVRDRTHLLFGNPGEDAANEGEADWLDALVRQNDAGSLWGDTTNDHDEVDVTRDLDFATSLMDDEQWALFALLTEHQDLPDACVESGVSTATFYRRVADLQLHLRMFGFRSAAGSPHITPLRKIPRSAGKNIHTPRFFAAAN